MSGVLSGVLHCVAGIRLAGATSEVNIMDVRTGRWEVLNPSGEAPSPRAAHAAAAVGAMVVVQVTSLAWIIESFDFLDDTARPTVQ